MALPQFSVSIYYYVNFYQQFLNLHRKQTDISSCTMFENMGGSVSTIRIFYLLYHSSTWFTYIIMWTRFLWTLSIIHNIMLMIENRFIFHIKPCTKFIICLRNHHLYIIRKVPLICCRIELIICIASEPLFGNINK